MPYFRMAVAKWNVHKKKTLMGQGAKYFWEPTSFHVVLY